MEVLSIRHTRTSYFICTVATTMGFGKPKVAVAVTERQETAWRRQTREVIGKVAKAAMHGEILMTGVRCNSVGGVVVEPRTTRRRSHVLSTTTTTTDGNTNGGRTSLPGNIGEQQQQQYLSFLPLSSKIHTIISEDDDENTDDTSSRRRRTASNIMNMTIRRNAWRDCLLLLVGCVSITIISYVETHAATGANESSPSSPAISTSSTTTDHGIHDTGFAITAPLYNFLQEHRHTYNDAFACLNSLLLLVPVTYGIYTIYYGDHSYIFRVLFTELLRSFCGWATYLPPSSEYLMSYYDFPDIIECLFGGSNNDCSGPYPDERKHQEGTADGGEVLPFVSFFSGHVAIVVICANHMYMMGYHRSGIVMHIMNIFQIVRLLATRGHYSIDIIVGWFIAVLGSNPAGRLGRYYSRGDSLSKMFLSENATEAFESITGIAQIRKEQRVSTLLKQQHHPEIINTHHDTESRIQEDLEVDDEEIQRLLVVDEDL